MKRNLLTLGVALLVGASTLTTASFDKAYANEQLQNKKSEIIKKRTEVQSDITDASKKIDAIEDKTAKFEAEVKRLDLAVAETSGKIREKSESITATRQEIEKLNNEIAEVNKRIEKRNELLKERARSLQESGGMVNYLDVLLGAQSFGDFLDRVGAVSTIVNADKDIINAHKEDLELKEKKENEVQAKLEKLENDLAELKKMNETLKVQIAEKDKVIAELNKQKKQLEQEVVNKQEEAELLAAQQKAVQESINKYNAEQERIRREKAEQAAKQARSNNNGPSVQNDAPAPAVSSGTFTRPAAGPITSGFGWRTLNGRQEFHKGIDIANRAANVPVVAAADGVVFRSYYSASYGNVIFVSHNINGKIYTTVYAHLESRIANAGQTVSKGQMIGYMGNTGYSFGKHLHFEIHNGSWNAAKSNAVDPRSYIN